MQYKCILFAIFVLIVNTKAENVLSFSEIKGNHEEKVLTNKDEVIDINNSLQIQVNKFAIKSPEFGQYSEEVSAKVAKLSKINTILKYQNDILKAFQKTNTNPDSNQYDNFSSIIKKFYQLMEKDSVLSKEANEQLKKYFSLPKKEQNGIKGDIFVLNHFLNEAKQLSDSIDLSFEVSNKHFVVVAYIKGRTGERPVHIKNFDSIAAQKSYEVSRWVLSMSEKDKNLLQTYQELADSANNNLPAAFSAVCDKFSSSIKTIQIIKSLQVNLKVIRDSLNEENKQAIVILDSMINDAVKLNNNFDTLIALVNKKYIPKDISNFIDFTSSIKKIIDEICLLNDSIKPIPAVKANMDTISKDLKNMSNAFSEDKKNIDDFFNSIKSYFIPSKQLAAATETVSNNVTRFAFKAIPEKGYIDLTTTGMREDGDKITIKALLIENADNQNNNTIEITLEKRSFSMFRLGFHGDVAVTFNMICPDKSSSDQIKIPRKFQYSAASYFLFKWNMENSFYNSFVDPGVGAAVPLADLNLDGKPDLCLGGVFSVFKNILSIGYGYDFDIDAKYWFFGISLPFINGFSFPMTKETKI
jgi:hypothetical protein